MPARPSSGECRPPASESAAPTGTRPSWWARVVIGALLATMFFVALGRLPLIDPDEGRYARIPQEMLQTGDFITPRLDGVLYFEKPPLYYWLNAAAMTVLGRSEAANRVWSALFGLAELLLVFALARSVAGERAGLLAALVLGTSVLFVAASHFNSIDPTVTFFIVATLASFWFAHRSRGRRALWYWLATFAAAAMAVMAKGLIGVVIPAGVVVLYLAVTRQLGVLIRVPWLRGSALFAVITAPWFVLVSLRNPGFLWYFFVHEHLLRYTTDVASRGEPAWFFVVIAVVGLLPWTGAVVASVALLRDDARTSRPDAAHLVQLLWIWALVVLIFFSFSHSKLAAYILPALAPMATLGALALDRAFDPAQRLLRRLTGAGMVVGGLVTAAVAVGLCRALAGGLPHFHFADAVRPWDLALAAAAAAMAVLGALLWLRGRVRGAIAAATVIAVVTWALLLHTAGAAAASTSTKGVAEALKNEGAREGEVYTFYSFPHSLAFYLGQDLRVIAFHGELDYGIHHAAEPLRHARFPSFAEFRARWTSGTRTFVVVKRKDLPWFQDEELPLGRVVSEGPWLVVMTNQ